MQGLLKRLGKIFHTTNIFASFYHKTNFARLDLNRILKLDWFQLPHTRHFWRNIINHSESALSTNKKQEKKEKEEN